VVGVFFAVQIGFYGVFVASTMAHLPPEALTREMGKLTTNGDVLAAVTLISSPACALALIIIVALKHGASLSDTFALNVAPPAAFVRWLLALAAFAVTSDAVSWLIGEPIVPEFMEAVYRSADSKATLWFAIVVAAPLFEELLFRGFVITGLSRSRIGPIGAVIVAAVAWAAIHLQYDLYGIGTIMLLGLLFGAARVRTGSVVVPMALHMASNVIAMAEAAVKVG
jgi:membrane protease YdiL (CAAX protease family)